MRIKDNSPKLSSWIKITKAWRIPVAVGLLAVAYLLGYISNPTWNLNTSLDSIKKFLIKTDKAIVGDLRQEMGLYTTNGLATIFLDIPFESLLSIENKRTEALISGILLTSDDDFVPASMHLNSGQPFSVKIRLKGDWVDHLVGDKWSFRIHIEDPSEAILGMKRFSIQAPETRRYEKEWVYHQNLIQEGILTPRYYFVNIVQNGKFNGIYALEESFTEDLLESQSRREGPIIRFSEDLLWKNWENLGIEDSEIEKAVRQIGKFWLTDAGSSEITAFRQNHLTQDELLSGELFTAIELLYSFNQGLLSGDEVFDQELWGKFFALTDLWGSGHSTGWHNLRFYYNPVTGLLEPVVFDALPFEPSATRDTLAFPFGEQGFIQKIFRIPGIQKSYVTNLERVTKTNYLSSLENSYGPELDHFHKILTNFLEKGFFGDIPPIPWDDLRLRAGILANNLESPQPIQGNYKIIQLDGIDHLELYLSNLMVLPVEITELLLDESTQQIDKEWCVDQACLDNIINDGSSLIIAEYAKIRLIIPISDLDPEIHSDSIISVTGLLYGGSTLTTNPLSTNYDPEGIISGARPRNTIGYVLENHPYIEQIDPGNLAFIPGTWDVEGDLVLPDNTNLTIPAGTTLFFDKGAILLINGSFDLQGQVNKPILLSAKEYSWEGIVVIGNGSGDSTWTHAVIENTAGITRGGWVLTGGITFYEESLNLSQVKIGQNTSEDALNIIRADFNFQNVEFYQTTSDAFDGDFTQGTIQNCSLRNIGGDGFDFSGSIVSITDSEFLNIGDKSISAGENSIVTITNSKIENTNIGIASKDLSEVTVDSVTIDNARVAGLAVFIKKPQYGPAYLNADRINFVSTEIPSLCQTGSTLILFGVKIQCKDIDVESLYDQGTLEN